MASYRVLVIGDSISNEGYWPGSPNANLTPSQIWVADLESWLNSTFPWHSWTVTSKAHSGFTWQLWSSANAYISNPLGEITSFDPHFVFYLLGVNDALSYSVSAMQGYMDTVLNTVDGCPNLMGVVGCSLVRLDEGKSTAGLTNTQLITYSDAVKTEAQSRGHQWADIWAAFEALQTNPPSWTEVHPYFWNTYPAGDGIHPSESGHDVMWSAINQPAEDALAAAGIMPVLATADADSINLTWEAV